MSEANATIVWADDQPELFADVRDRLAARGYSIAVAKNGTDAAAYIEEHFPALLIVDIRMPPGVDGGLWLVEHVRKVLRSNVATLMLSGNGTKKEAAQAIKLGADSFVDKAESAESIEHEIMRFLAEHRDEQHDHALAETRDELDVFEKDLRRHVRNILLEEFGMRAFERLVQELEQSLPAEKLSLLKAEDPDLNAALEHTYLSNLELLLVRQWNRISAHFDKVGMRRAEFIQRFDGVLAIRNRLSHANYVPMMELLRTRLFIYDARRALTSRQAALSGTEKEPRKR